MKKTKLTLIFISILAMFLFACGGSSDTNHDEDETTNNSEVVNEKETTNTEIELNELTTQESCGFAIESKEDFLYYVVSEGVPATFENSDGIYIFFREDGTMAGGGPTGEGSMWEANWTFTPGALTGTITFEITMGASDGSYQMGGAYNVEYFPDDSALIFNCVDFIKQDY